MTASPPPALALAVVPSPGHDDRGHPEHAGRIPAILAALAADDVTGDGAADRLPRLAVEPASFVALARVHHPRYLEALHAAMDRAPAVVDAAPTYITPTSFDDARRSAGAALAAVDAVLDGRAGAAFALGRPPGHHARPAAAMGFCLLANAAVAVRHAQARGIGRVLVVDFDVHHGNGTQEVFWDDGSVVFVSCHQRGAYPGGGAIDEVGAGAGAGATVNVPLPAGAGDLAFGRVMAEVVAPVAERARPELVVVSAGFDAAWRDPLAQLTVTGAGFHAAARALRDLARRHAEGRIAFVLEGGYDLAALGEGVVHVARAVHDAPPTPAAAAASPHPEPPIDAVLAAVRTRHALPGQTW